MADLKNVIKGLEQFITDFKPFCGNKADWQRVDDALALLKAQEPRVMTPKEISSINGGDIVWIEDRSLDEMIAGIKYQSPSKNCYYVFLIGSTRPKPFSKEMYEINWRCWTSRPTDKQREAVKWKWWTGRMLSRGWK